MVSASDDSATANGRYDRQPDRLDDRPLPDGTPNRAICARLVARSTACGDPDLMMSGHPAKQPVVAANEPRLPRTAAARFSSRARLKLRSRVV